MTPLPGERGPAQGSGADDDTAVAALAAVGDRVPGVDPGETHAAEPTDDVAEPGASSEPGALSERDRDILEFERQWWKHAGAKERAVRDRFGFSATRYFQVLNTLLDRPEALAHDPMLVQRLRRLREARQHARSTVRRPGR
ncbi:DUF3263 domain-containing protein [Streptomyces sp. SID3343]|uniref:DUF3263 domain-containing protein n=1 Tax=Streptomyces sp. SID3343 TaxID=2690260 RepID=UPI0031F728C7